MKTNLYAWAHYKMLEKDANSYDVEMAKDVRALFAENSQLLLLVRGISDLATRWPNGEPAAAAAAIKLAIQEWALAKLPSKGPQV